MPDSVPPPDWRRVRLDEISRAVGGVGFPLDQQGLTRGSWPMVKVSDLNRAENAREIVTAENWLDEPRRGAIGARILQPGTVVFPKVGAALMSERRRRLGVAAALDNNLMGLEPDEHVVLSEFLLLLLNRVKLAALAQTTALPSINQSLVGSIEVLLPPLPEQRAIAAVLDAVEDTIELTEAMIAATEELRRALLHELLTRGVPGWHSEWKHVPGLGTVPACWEIATLEELADPSLPGAMQSGPFGSSLLHSEFQSEGKLVIGIDNVLDGRFSLGRQHRISDRKFQELRRYQARPHDVLITVMASLGRVCVVPEDVEDAIVTKHVYRISPDQDRIEPSFMMWCLLAAPGVLQQLYGSAQGQTRLGLNGQILKGVRIPVPPLQEQLLVSRALASTTEQHTAGELCVATLQGLKAALAHVLLSGEIRIRIPEVA